MEKSVLQIRRLYKFVILNKLGTRNVSLIGLKLHFYSHFFYFYSNNQMFSKTAKSAHNNSSRIVSVYSFVYPQPDLGLKPTTAAECAALCTTRPELLNINFEQWRLC